MCAHSQISFILNKRYSPYLGGSSPNRHVSLRTLVFPLQRQVWNPPPHGFFWSATCFPLEQVLHFQVPHLPPISYLIPPFLSHSIHFHTITSSLCRNYHSPSNQSICTTTHHFHQPSLPLISWSIIKYSKTSSSTHNIEELSNRSGIVVCIFYFIINFVFILSF